MAVDAENQIGQFKPGVRCPKPDTCRDHFGACQETSIITSVRAVHDEYPTEENAQNLSQVVDSSHCLHPTATGARERARVTLRSWANRTKGSR